MATSSTADAKKKRAEQVARISTKVHAFFWVVVAIVVGVGSDIINVLLASPKVERTALIISGVSGGVVLSIYFYLAIYLEYIAGIRLAWAVYAPNMIPTATAAGIIGALSLIVSLWPVYGLLTPAIVALLAMGLIMSTHFIPMP